MEELKPCPFCGSMAELMGNGRNIAWVQCSNHDECWCGMTSPVRTNEEAIKIWNRRSGNEQ